ncbi:putative ribonuclease H-like domain-containing protein [Tanacetum coccineum]
MAFMSALSTSSTNDEVSTASPKVSTGSTNVNTGSTQDSTASLNDLEEMDLKWQLALLSMRARRNPRNQDSRGRNHDTWNMNQDSTRRIVNVKDTSSKAMLAIDGVGFDWSNMVEEQVQTNMALMAFSDYECDDLIVKLNDSEFKTATYKRGLSTLEDQLVTYKKNEVLFCEEIGVLKREVGCKEYELGILMTELEKVKKEKENIDFKITKFDKSSKDLDEMLESQRSDKDKQGLDKFKEPEFNEYGPRDTVLECTIDYDKESDNSKKNTNDSLEKEQVSDNENISVESSPSVVKETVFMLLKRYFNQIINTARPRVVNTARPNRTSVNAARANGFNAVKPSACWVWRPTKPNGASLIFKKCKPQMNDKGFVDIGCSRHMTGNIAYPFQISKCMTMFNEVKGFNLFSVSQMCDKKNYVLFTDSECLVLSPNFKLPDENQILLRIPREDNMYSFDMKNIVPKESLTCLVAKATSNKSMLWHGRLGKQHRASCKSKVYRVFFLATKGETSEILKNFIIQIENLVDQKVKIIRCDNGTEFKNNVMDDFCKEKGIKREYSVARTPQQNGVAERRNRTLIEAARTMLADSKLPTTFWAEAVSTACYVQNRVLIVKPHNKTPYELFRGIKPALSFMKPFGCHVTILNTLDHLGKFDGKSDEGFFVGYSLSSKAFRVYNTRTKKVEENLHIGFLENKPMIEGNGPKWLFDIDSLTQSMNYVPVTAGTSTNESAGTQEDQNAGTFLEKDGTSQDCVVMPIWKDASYFDSPSKQMGNDDPKSIADDPKENEDGSNDECIGKEKSKDDSSTKQDNTADQPVNTASPGLNTGGIRLNTVGSSVNTATSEDMVGPSHSLKATHDEFFNDEDEPDVGLGNIINSYAMKEPNPEQGFLSAVYEAKTHKDVHTYLFACFLSQEEPKRVSKALNLPKGHRAIGTKWVFRNKKDERGIVIRNKARLVAQGHTQEEGIDYNEVFAPVARIEAIRLFLAYASFTSFMVYQMDVKSTFPYGQIEEEVYVCQSLGFEDPDYPDKVYKVVKTLYGLHQALRAWYETLANYLLGNGFHRGKIDQTLFIKKQKGDILLVQIYMDDIIFGSTKKELCTEFKKLMKDNQDKYVDEILRKFNYTDVKTASTTIDMEKPLVKDGDADDFDVHLYRSMIGSLMYLTSSRPDIMFAVCACARFQVTPKTSHLLVVKRIFRYLKCKPTLGLWYSRNSPFELVAYTDSDYARATQR